MLACEIYLRLQQHKQMEGPDSHNQNESPKEEPIESIVNKGHSNPILPLVKKVDIEVPLGIK